MLNSNTQNNGIIPHLIDLGPEVYQTSDADLKAHIEQALSLNRGVDLSQVEIKVFEGDVSISGVVTSDQMTHIEDEIIRCGPRDIENLLRIKE